MVLNSGCVDKRIQSGFIIGATAQSGGRIPLFSTLDNQRIYEEFGVTVCVSEHCALVCGHLLAS